jgi:hypothetical protein
LSVVLVSGAIANKQHNGGEAWVRLSWVLGLRRLGCEVYFVEQIDEAGCVDAGGRPATFEESANLEYFRTVTERFGIADRSSLLCDGGERAAGIELDRLLEIGAEADLLVNISGHLALEPVMRTLRRKAYVDLDPGFTQFWHASGDPGARLQGHDLYFTVGENIGAPDCAVPTDGIEWRAVRPPVLLDEWPVSEGDDPSRFTTIATWRSGYGTLEYEGTRYGLKVHEFRKVMELPERAPAVFELALDIHPGDAADRESLEAHGWRIVDPRAVSADPDRFRDYVSGSGAEFSVAQGIYVEAATGWFSDRTVRYLAAGKPALVQDTGFSRNYPTGEGLVPFSTLDQAVEGARRIGSDYERHCEAARELAERCFDSDKVLSRFLEEAGVR